MQNIEVAKPAIMMLLSTAFVPIILHVTNIGRQTDTLPALSYYRGIPCSGVVDVGPEGA